MTFIMMGRTMADVIRDEKKICPKCGGHAPVRGGEVLNSGRVRRYQCLTCGHRYAFNEDGSVREPVCQNKLTVGGELIVRPEPKNPPKWKVRELLAGVTTPALRERLERLA